MFLYEQLLLLTCRIAYRTNWFDYAYLYVCDAQNQLPLDEISGRDINNCNKVKKQMWVAVSSPCLRIQLCKRTSSENSASFCFIPTQINLQENVFCPIESFPRCLLNRLRQQLCCLLVMSSLLYHLFNSHIFDAHSYLNNSVHPYAYLRLFISLEYI